MCCFLIKTLYATLSIVVILCTSAVHSAEIETDGQSKKYALLVGGGVSKQDTFESFYTNIEYVSDSLKQMGYRDENVKILFFGGNTPTHPIVEGDATKNGFIEELILLENEIDSNDSLIIFRAGHGIIDLVLKKYDSFPKIKDRVELEGLGNRETIAMMRFPDGDLSYFELGERLCRIKAKQIIVVLNQCFAGQFTDITKIVENSVVISETRENEFAFYQTRDTIRWKYDVWPFVKCFFDGFLHNSSKTGKKSVYYAFQYMLLCNPHIDGIPVQADRPLLKENPLIKYGSELKEGTVFIY